jgi:hypothetical protein
MNSLGQRRDTSTSEAWGMMGMQLGAGIGAGMASGKIEGKQFDVLYSLLAQP